MKEFIVGHLMKLAGSVLAAAVFWASAGQAEAAIATTAEWNASSYDKAAFDPAGMSVIRMDDFGIYDGLNNGLTAISGSLSADFYCNSMTSPCSGAYEYAVILPYEVRGISGKLTAKEYRFSLSTLSLVSETVQVGAYNPETGGNDHGGFYYDGSFTAIFEPTNVLTFSWLEGYNSRDNTVRFTLSDFQVLLAASSTTQVAVPEPGTVLLLSLGALGLGAIRRRIAG